MYQSYLEELVEISCGHYDQILLGVRLVIPLGFKGLGPFCHNLVVQNDFVHNLVVQDIFFHNLVVQNNWLRTGSISL